MYDTYYYLCTLVYDNNRMIQSQLYYRDSERAAKMKALVTYEAVSNAAEALSGRGERPSLRAIRAELGGLGSLTTIQGHFLRWQNSQQQQAQSTQTDFTPPDDAARLWNELCRVFQRDVSDKIARAMEALTSELQGARESLTALQSENEQLMAEVGEQQERVTALACERDTLAGKLSVSEDERTRIQREIDKLHAELAAERFKTSRQSLELDTVRKESDSVRTQAQALQADTAKLRDDRDTLNLRLTETLGEVGRLKEEKAKQETEFERKMTERVEVALLKERALHQEQVGKLQRELGVNQERVSTLQAQIMQVRAEAETVKQPKEASKAKKEEKQPTEK
jgi:predicted nuclease with TOPRIM domain